MSVVSLKYCVGLSEVFKDSASDEAEAELLIHASQSDGPFKNNKTKYFRLRLYDVVS